MRLLLVGLLANLLFGQPEVFVVNENRRSVQPVLTDPVRALDSFTTPNSPAFFFVNADRTKYYSVARSATGTVAVLSAAQPSTVLRTLDLSAATAAVMTPDRSRLLVCSAQWLYVIDTATDTLLVTVSAGLPVTSVAVSPDGSRAYLLATTVTTIDLTSSSSSGISLSVPPHAIAVNHTGLVYASAEGRVYELDGRTGQLRRTIEVSGRPGRLAFSPSGRVAVAGSASGSTSMFRFDLVAGVVSGTVSATGIPFDDFVFLDEDRAMGFSSQRTRLVPVAIEPLQVLPIQVGGGFSRGILASPEFPAPRQFYVNYDNAAIEFDSEGFANAPSSHLGTGFATISPRPGVGVPAHLYAFNGDQTTLPGHQYPLPLMVRVTNRAGRPLSGVMVDFSTGHAAYSNADGWAQYVATAPLAGAVSPITATAGEARAIFRLGSPAAAAASISILEGQGQLLDIQRRTPRPIRVVVKDADGFPVPDTPVTFTLAAGTGRLGCTTGTVCTVRTDGSGMAVIGFALNSTIASGYFEQQKVDITSGAAPRRSVFITAATENNIIRQTIAPSGTIVTGAINSLLPNAAAVRFWGRDLSNAFHPLPNIGLTYTSPLDLPDLRCNAEGGTVLADSTGLASCSLIAGGIAGAADLLSRMPEGRLLDQFDSPSSISRVVISSAGRPSIQVLAGGNQTVWSGQPGTPLSIRLVNAQGEPMPNQPLEWSIDGRATPDLLIAPSTQTDSSGLGSAGVVTPSSFGLMSGWFLIRVRSNGAVAEIPVFMTGIEPRVEPQQGGLSPYGGTLSIRLGNIGTWSVQGLPPWLRASPTSGSGAQWLVLDYDPNLSATDTRTANFTIGGRSIQLEQRARPRPSVSALGQPAPTSGPSADISVNFHAALDASRLNVLNILIRDALDGSNACYIAYSAPQRVLYLVSDQGPNILSPPMALRSPQSVSNSQCTIHGADSMATEASTTIRLRLRITFNSSFAGPKLIYAGASDLASVSSGWRVVGTHAVPGPIVWPRPVSATPAPVIGFTSPASYTFEFEDATNARNLETVWILNNSSLDGRQACYLAFHVPSSQLFLFPDSGLASGLQSLAFPSGGQMGNSSCFVSLANATVTVSGRRLTLALNVTFRNRGAIWMAAKTLSGEVSSWQAMNVTNAFP
jgi:hypothetical protein